MQTSINPEIYICTKKSLQKNPEPQLTVAESLRYTVWELPTGCATDVKVNIWTAGSFYTVTGGIEFIATYNASSACWKHGQNYHEGNLWMLSGVS